MAKIKDVLQSARHRLKAAGIESHALDARLLLQYAAGISQEDMISSPERILCSKQNEAFQEIIAKRITGKPVSKILGVREFYGLNFLVSEDVLDPRPETEFIVEAVLKILRAEPERHFTLLDLGTGSGCIPVSILVEADNVSATAADISDKALEVAQKNAQKYLVSDRVAFMQSDWCSAVSGRFDLIVSNPPYIRSNEIDDLAGEVRHYDPMPALDGGLDGLDAYRNILAQLKPLTYPQTKILLEIGWDQAEALVKIADTYGFVVDGFLKDLQGHNRIICLSTGKR